MSEKLQPISSAILPSSGASTNITLPGDGNTLIAQANVVNMKSVYIPVVQANGVTLPTRRTINADYYNLFIIGDETFTGGYFIVPKKCALTESIAPELKALYAKLDMDAVATIKTFPAIFAGKNHQYCCAGGNQEAYLGFVNDISIQDNGIRVSFHLLYAIPQRRLNELACEISIDSASAFNEFDSTHWTIKRINIIEKLRNAGLDTLL
ncbi:hypothetical protein [Ethanoligenens sp.]|uniref:hypothetical protein n=1 Tax=Ethanoligenens sp. TaxID=2099655 RepID=UPI0039ED4D23